MLKGGYQILDFSSIPLETSGADDDVFLDETIMTQEELNKIGAEMYRKITSTDKPIVISGLKIKNTDSVDGLIILHDFIVNPIYTSYVDFGSKKLGVLDYTIIIPTGDFIPITNDNITVTINKDGMSIKGY